MEIENKKIAFLAGSFDPFTTGHLEIIRRALEEDFHVIVGIGVNPDKTPWFSGEQRKSMIERVLYDHDLSDIVEVIIYTGLTGETAIEHSVDHFYRGVRNEIDRAYEEQMAAYNLEAFNIPTIIIEIPKKLGIVAFVSSSGVREFVRSSTKWPMYVKNMVPDAVLTALKIRQALPALKERFVQLFDRNGGNRSDALFCFDFLVRKYSDPTRCYHDLTHILDLLDAFDKLGREAFSNPDLIEFAIFYHDIEMDFTKTGGINEKRSAELAQYVVGRYLHTNGWYQEIYDIIMLTVHPSQPKTNDEQLFVALDLAILSVHSQRYERYVKSIRYEYRFANDEQWKVGRGSFLVALMNSDYWKSDSIWKNYIIAAEQNIKNEIISL